MTEPIHEFMGGVTWNLDEAGGNLIGGCGGSCGDCACNLPNPTFNEQDDLLQRFMQELRKPTGDGAVKRSKNEKPPWYIDPAHEAAIFSHLSKWKKGELVDPDSGAHPLVHAAWRALAIACKETGNVPLTDEGYPDTFA